MGRKYRQGRKIFWATLALVLLLVVLPGSIMAVQWWDNTVSSTKVVAYQLTNETNVPARGWTNGVLCRMTLYEGLATGQTMQLSPFWSANGTNEVIIPQYTANTTYTEALYIGWNLTPEKALSDNVQTVHIVFSGLNENGSTTVHLSYFSDTTGYTIVATTANIQNGTLDVSLSIDAAKLAYAQSYFPNTPMTLWIKSPNSTYSAFQPGSVVKFSVVALKPHGNILVFGQYGAIQFLLLVWSFAGMFVLVVTSPAWNPTTGSGLIEKMLKHHKYAKRSKARRKRRKKKRRRR